MMRYRNRIGNVQNAFATVSALKNAMDGIDGPKWFIAHSLGNMVVSAAAQDWGMQYERYFMLNAAVPVEAYDATAVTMETRASMTPPLWSGYAERLKSVNWRGSRSRAGRTSCATSPSGSGTGASRARSRRRLSVSRS